jgi:regulator of sigma E protease
MQLLQNVLFYFIPILLILGVVVTIHELGHFLAAKVFKTKIDTFSIGFGRALASWRDKAGTEWRIAWIPLGGYVKFAGDDNAASIPDGHHLAVMRRELAAQGRAAEIPQYFHFKPIWQRAIITAAGPVANFALSIAIFAALLFAFGEPITSTRVDTVEPGSAAEQAGFQVDNVVRTANGRPIDSFGQIQELVVLSTETPIRFTVTRDGQLVTLTATPRRGPVPDALGRIHMMGRLGLGHTNRPGDVTVRRYGPLEALGGGVERTWSTIQTTINYVGRIFSGRENADQLAGPLGMAQLSGDVAKKTAENSAGTLNFLANFTINQINLVAMISVGIGFINLLPVPVLDGGHLLFYAYEAVARRPLGAKVQAAGYRVGLALVLGLMLFATWNDMQRLRVFNLFGGLFS